ncbi:hypothetical protein ACT4ML_15445 [Natrinema sp. LN54]|uniref:hypothetical protein n=1 Tax=Natrinema sp. LN54 TaxID=3458705 RepID=UPI004036945B
MADGKYAAIIADTDHGPDRLVSVFQSMLTLAGPGRTRPLPMLVISNLPLGVDDEIRVPIQETYLKNVFIHAGAVELL